MDPLSRPVQLRLGLERAGEPLELHLSLAGLLVLTDAPGGRAGAVWSNLASVGIPVEPYDGGGVAFPVRHLANLTALPEFVTVRVDRTLAPLWDVVSNPPDANLPVTLERDARGGLWVRWRSGNLPHTTSLDPESAPAFLGSDIAFVAAPDAWVRLRELSRLPVQAGRAKLNLDGFIEIYSSKPQLVEAAPIPGLFRLDETHFGVALGYADSIDAAPGFTWDGPRPHPETAPAHLPELPVSLSGHASSDLSHLAGHLAESRAAAVVWDPGLGRRIITLAAVEALEAWPALIVTAPAGVWIWHRHLALVGRRGALSDPEADARIVTYLDLARGAAVGDPAAIIFDDPGVGEGALPAARKGCLRLGGVLDAYRVAVCSSWPDKDPELQVQIMSLLRPGEFRADVPLALRYPLRPAERAAEHAAAYLTRRRSSDPGRDRTEYRRSSVHTVEPTAAQMEHAARLLTELENGAAPSEVLREYMELVSLGSTHATSPKLAAALEIAGQAALRGSRIAVLTRHRGAASLLSVLLTPHRTAVVEPSAGQHGVDAARAAADVVVVVFSTSLPGLHGFDEVLVLDYPWSLATLDEAVGPPAGPGPREVTVLHAPGTVDDRLAVFAALRRENEGWSHADPAGDQDAIWILTPRTPLQPPAQ
jgi:hypothetical protein